MNRFGSLSAACLLALGVFLVLGDLASASPCLKSRAVQNLGCNCYLNQYFRKEYELGLEYLNASNHMMSDRVAQHGFGRMYRSFWHEQLELSNTVRKYIIKRGGQIIVPSMRFFSDRRPEYDHFINEERVLNKFLVLEKAVNLELLTLHKCVSSADNRIGFESTCVEDLRDELLYECPSSYMNSTLGELERDLTAIDPATANFLDSHMLAGKVNRIKLLADLQAKLERQYVRKPGRKAAEPIKRAKRDLYSFDHLHDSLDQLGVFIIDRELQQQFN